VYPVLDFSSHTQLDPVPPGGQYELTASEFWLTQILGCRSLFPSLVLDSWGLGVLNCRYGRGPGHWPILRTAACSLKKHRLKGSGNLLLLLVQTRRMHDAGSRVAIFPGCDTVNRDCLDPLAVCFSIRNFEKLWKTGDLGRWRLRSVNGRRDGTTAVVPLAGWNQHIR